MMVAPAGALIMYFLIFGRWRAESDRNRVFIAQDQGYRHGGTHPHPPAGAWINAG